MKFRDTGVYLRYGTSEFSVIAQIYCDSFSAGGTHDRIADESQKGLELQYLCEHLARFTNSAPIACLCSIDVAIEEAARSITCHRRDKGYDSHCCEEQGKLNSVKIHQKPRPKSSDKQSRRDRR